MTNALTIYDKQGHLQGDLLGHFLGICKLFVLFILWIVDAVSVK